MATCKSTLIAIGGALSPASPILEDFYDRSGGTNSRLVIIPTASTQPDTAAYLTQVFHQIGSCATLTTIPVFTRPGAFEPHHLALIQEATGIFFTGGSQARITATLGGTPVETALLDSFARGTVIAGTSAGAACLSAIMFASGKSGPSPRQSMAQLVPGLGFSKRVIFDQHFRQRDRLGRLLFAICYHPGIIGVGVDEDTAAILEKSSDDKETISVVGKNSVTIVDGYAMINTDVAETMDSQPVAFSGITLHVLSHGSTYDLNTRLATLPGKKFLAS